MPYFLNFLRCFRLQGNINKEKSAWTSDVAYFSHRKMTDLRISETLSFFTFTQKYFQGHGCGSKEM